MYRIVILIISILLVCSCASQKFDKATKLYRTNYKEKFQKSDHAPLKGSQLDSMRFFSPNKKYKVKATSDKILNGEVFEIPTSSGMQKSFRPYAKLYFTIDGVEHNLTVYQNLRTIQMPQYKDYLFLPFTDLTNGESTYGGGRYLDLRTGDFNKEYVWLDFNKAYNPYCHYSNGYNCPIPPKENKLSIAILAGEMKYTGQYIGDH